MLGGRYYVIHIVTMTPASAMTLTATTATVSRWWILGSVVGRTAEDASSSPRMQLGEFVQARG